MASASASSPPRRPSSPALSDDDTASILSGSGTGTGTGTGTRLGSLASAQLSTFNLSSLGLPVQQTSSASSSSTLLGGFNAISTVLNNPKKKQHPIDPHSSRFTPLPAHKEAEIARVHRDAVQGYIDDVGQEWRRYVRNRDLGKRGKARMSGGSGEEEEEADGGDDTLDGNPIAQAAASALAGKALPPLTAVPQIFFDEEFNLGNPYTFDVVTEKYGSTSGSNGNGEDGQGPPTDHLEKLSHYSDLVEQHLLHEISTRSSSFFSALGALQDLSQSSASCLSLIRSLRSDLVSISDSQVKAGLHIVRRQDERWTLLEEMRGVELIQHWCEGKRMAELMVGQGEYDEALLVIERLKEQARDGGDDDEEDTSHAVQLSRIPAILALLPQLDDLQANISQALESELASVLNAELEQRGRLAEDPSSSPWHLLPRVEPLLNGLVRTQGLERTLTAAYRPLVLASVRSALRSSLPRPEDDAALTALFDLLDDDLAATGQGESKSGEAGMVAARRLREMSTTEFLDNILDKACAGLEGVLGAIAQQKRHLLRALDAMARREGVEEEGQDDEYLMPSRVPFSLAQSLTSQLHSSIEVAHILLARLISLRASSHIELPLREFLSISHPLMAFAQRTERISVSTRTPSTRRLIPLRSTLLNQSKEWLRQFHRVRLEKAARYVEEETWSQVDVKQRDVDVVRRLVACATRDPKEWAVQDGVDDGGPDGSVDRNGDTAPADAKPLPTLPVPADDESDANTRSTRSYYVVPATIHVVHLTQEYMTTLVNFSQMAAVTEVMSRAVEFLKQFNSRTCQVVLGAGAMRSAGLKNITAKHLALASQSLSLFIHLIPYLRECVRRHLPDERQAVMLIEFDKLKRDFQEHQNEIHSKLVAIMGDRLGVHCKGLAAIDWNGAANNATNGPSKPIADLVKETMTLQKVLTRYLAPTTVDSVLNQVLDAILKRVGVEFARVEVTSESCRGNMSRDVQYLDSKLGGLKSLSEGIVWDAEALKGVVEAKTAARVSTEEPQQQQQSAQPPLPPSSAPSTPQLSSVSSPRNSSDITTTPTQGGPAAYKSRMFPFGRRAAAAATGGQQSPSGNSTPTQQSQSQSQSQQSYFPSYVSRGGAALGANAPPQTPTKGGLGPARVLSSAQDEEAGEQENTVVGGITVDEPAAAQEPSSDDVVAVADADGELEKVDEPDTAPTASANPEDNVPAARSVDEPATVEDAETGDAAAAAANSTTSQQPRGTDTSSPAASSSSTDEPSNATTGGSDSPTPSTARPARMTLQQRLAEAARKRSQQAQKQKQQQSGSDSIDSAASTSTDTPPPTPAKDGVGDKGQESGVGTGLVAEREEPQPESPLVQANETAAQPLAVSHDTQEGGGAGGGGEGATDPTSATGTGPARPNDENASANANGTTDALAPPPFEEDKGEDTSMGKKTSSSSMPDAQTTTAAKHETEVAHPIEPSTSVSEATKHIDAATEEAPAAAAAAASPHVAASPAVMNTVDVNDDDANVDGTDVATNVKSDEQVDTGADAGASAGAHAKTAALPQPGAAAAAAAAEQPATAVISAETDTPAATPSSDVEDHEQPDAGSTQTTADSAAPSTSGGGGGKKKNKKKKKGGGGGKKK